MLSPDSQQRSYADVTFSYLLSYPNKLLIESYFRLWHWKALDLLFGMHSENVQ